MTVTLFKQCPILFSRNTVKARKNHTLDTCLEERGRTTENMGKEYVNLDQVLKKFRSDYYCYS